MQDNEANEILYTLKEASTRLRVAESTVWRWVDRGLIPAYRLPGRRIRLKKEDVEAAMKPVKAGEIPAAPPDHWREWVVYETGSGLPAETVIARAKALRARILRRRRGVPLPDSVEDIRQMREERSRQMDAW